MKRLKNSFEQIFIASHLLRWTILVIPVSMVTGSLVACFLWLLEKALRLRFDNPWLLFLLPLAGIFIFFLYKFSGRNSEAGTNLIMNEIHEPGGGVPARMAPLVLISTVITHLFGGSAGREGTAVQIGGSVARYFAKIFKLSGEDIKIILMAGVAAGFGAVFGTPVTGAIFAMEVIAIGSIKYNALLPCLIASILSDIICASWGIQHTLYHINRLPIFLNDFFPGHFDFKLLMIIILAGVLFGLTSLLFSKITDAVKEFCSRFIKIKWMIPAIGGMVVIGFVYFLGTRDYLGLGVTNPNVQGVSILSCFQPGGATSFSWLWKLLFTAVTLGTGFKGGEVTPLFFIGAALGNTIGMLTGVPVDLMAGLGFIAVFAGATNTPIACTLMGVELFGSENILYFAVACFTAYYFSGHSGIYDSQQIAVSKGNKFFPSFGVTLHELKNRHIGNRKKDFTK